MPEKVLNDIKIIEFASMVSGPYCGKLMADMGADVVKIETTEGDPARSFGPFPTTDLIRNAADCTCTIIPTSGALHSP